MDGESQILLKENSKSSEKTALTLESQRNLYKWEEKNFAYLSPRFHNQKLNNFGQDLQNCKIFQPSQLTVEVPDPGEVNEDDVSNQVKQVLIESQNRSKRKRLSTKTNEPSPQLRPSHISSEIDSTKLISPRSKLFSPRSNTPTGKLHRFGPEIFVSLKSDDISEFYHLEGEVIGRGGFGKVVIGYQHSTGIKRAVKLIKRNEVYRSDEDKLFMEASILREIDHPNVIKLFEVFENEEYYYLITEYINGGDLIGRLQCQANFSEETAAEYMRQVFSALVYLHEKKIMHRDIKPENLLFDSRKPGAMIKLIDFGAAMRFQPGTKLSKRVGTCFYMAPEVLNRLYDEKCDLWSCGVMLYLFLSGKPPFQGQSEVELLHKIKRGKFTFDQQIWKGVSNDAKDLISKLLTLKPENRISAADALKHPWLQKRVKYRALPKKLVLNISSFKARNKLYRVILMLIASQLTPQKETEDLQRDFYQFDKNSHGTLTLEELTEGFTKIVGNNVNTREMTRIFNRVDVNGSGVIDYSEFVMAAMDKENFFTTEKISQAFAIFDRDNDGFITLEEFRTTLGGIELLETEWRKLIAEADTNNDGQISKEEFENFMIQPSRKSKTLDSV